MLLTFILIFLAGLHLYKNWRIQPHSLYLAGALIFIAQYFVHHYLFIYGTSEFWLAFFYGHGTPTQYLIGPMLFFYVRGVLTDNHQLKRRDIWHFVPAFIDLLTRIPYFMKPWSHKLMMARQMVADMRHLHDFANEFFPPSYIAMPLRIGSMIAYSIVCLRMVWQFRLHYPIRTRVPLALAKVQIRFLNYLLGVCLLAEICLLTLLLIFFTDKSFNQHHVLNSPLLFISFLGLLSIPVIIQLHPEVLYGIPKWRSGSKEQEEPETSSDEQKSLPVQPESGDEKNDVALDRFREMATQITNHLETERPYLHPDFSIEDLSKSLGIPKHHLYYCFNQMLKKRFTQVRTTMRIHHACELIRNGATQEKTLEAIGLESGFSSRSAFILAFREVTGMTPRDFQRSLEGQ